MAPRALQLDVRPLPLWQRLDAVLAAWAALTDDDSLELLVEFDPSPLRLYLSACARPACTWEPIEEGPVVWRVRLWRRTGPAP